MTRPFQDFAPQVRRVAPLPVPDAPTLARPARANLAPQASRVAPLPAIVKQPRPVHPITYAHLRRLPEQDLAPGLRPVHHYYDPASPLDPKWRERAVCAGKGATPEAISLWFPGPGGAQRGKLYCAVCPVRRECSDYADQAGITWGIWGGEIRSRTNQQPKKTEPRRMVA